MADARVRAEVARFGGDEQGERDGDTRQDGLPLPEGMPRAVCLQVPGGAGGCGQSEEGLEEYDPWHELMIRGMRERRSISNAEGVALRRIVM